MYVVACVPRVQRDVFTREHMGISVQRATTNVCLPGTAPIWGGWQEGGEWRGGVQQRQQRAQQRLGPSGQAAALSSRP